MGWVKAKIEAKVFTDGESKDGKTGKAKVMVSSKRKDGTYDTTWWITLLGFRENAEAVAALRKDEYVDATGRLIINEYEDKEGKTRVSYAMFVDRCIAHRPATGPALGPVKDKPKTKVPPPAADGFIDEDLPF